MIVICALSYQKGDVNKLIYGTDSYGFVCGGSYSFMGTTIDLRSRKNLYYLDPLQLLSTATIPYAKSICVETCPGAADLCSLTSFPCTNNDAFRCPYYAFAEDGLTGQLSGISLTNTNYFSSLTMANANISGASAVINVREREGMKILVKCNTVLLLTSTIMMWYA